MHPLSPSARGRDLVVAAAATVAVSLGAREVRTGDLRAAESRWFSAVNELSDRGFLPVWAGMQLGSLGGALVTGGAVTAAGLPELGRRLATVGALAWAGAKVVKPFAQRGRPGTLLDETRVLGRAQSGLGYPSGHAAVATAMAAATAPRVPRRWRLPLGAAALGVGASRVYVGAHLPLDVLGGVALGLGMERSVRVVTGRA